ncbi:MAG: TIGR02147 family protein [Bdellovibrionales bacterium]|nr:TIGR02147 family protein [Bdellovibrionales bacterium]
METSIQFPSEMLREKWTQKKTKNPKLSIRSWAGRMGIRSHAHLQEMLSGKKPIPKKYIPRFVETLDLNSREGLYLETLIDLDRAKSEEEKAIYLQRITDLFPKKARALNEIEAFHFLRDPLHTILLEMVDLEDFQSDEKWIQSRLYFYRSIKDIRAALDVLLSLKLIEREPNGHIAKKSSHLTNVRDVPRSGVKEYHKRVSELASKAVFNQPVESREFNAYSFNIKESSIPQAKIRIRKFIEAFLQEFESKSGEGEETYQLNVQMFSTTQLKDKRR